jgi:phenylacetyl-CoA:acceptor oxidoreductase subunit 2
MSFGPAPWQQTNWDARAAGNFIGGGAGAGLIIFATLSGVAGPALSALLLGGLALVGAGLLCVWLELGRPLRAFNVFLNARTSWMSREALAATLLFVVGVVAAAAMPDWRWAAAALALAFVYCQARMLQAAKGIPAWREPLLVPLLVTTGLAEGGGLFFVTATLHGSGTQSLLIVFGALLIARSLVWLAYRRRRLAATAPPKAAAALDRAGWVLQFAGTLAPLALIAVDAIAAGQTPIIAALAGVLAVLSGAYVKYSLVTPAGFNQGFALAHLPVRGARTDSRPCPSPGSGRGDI